MKKLLILVLMALAFTACQKDDDIVIKYQVSNNSSGFLVNYLNEYGELISDAIDANSAQDVWSYSFQAKQGQIVFISSIYDHLNDGIKVSILVDGKTFKQGASNNDTSNFVTVSGTIPYK